MRVSETERTSPPHVISQFIYSYGVNFDQRHFPKSLWQFVALERWCVQTKELVGPIPKSWFMRQKNVLGANIHETQSLLERSIADIASIIS